MDAFKRKSLYLAVVAGLGSVGVAGTASAVNISATGTGQVLIYPYYSVRGGTDTYVSVVNTTLSGKAVKVRFTEGKNSREVLDFNLYLSPKDVWTGAVVATADGAKLITADKSCTYPAIPAAGQPFVNYGYAGAVLEGIVNAGGDGESASLDRTREGYFEIIEMGTITLAADLAAITHSSAGVPASCATVQTATFIADGTGGTHALDVPTGGLAGTATLINVANGTDFGFDPVALAAFSTVPNWFPAGDIRPDMKNAFPVTSRVFKGGTAVVTDWTGSTLTPAVNAVSAVLMHNNVINEFVLDTATLSGTDWVVTMPTKRYYVPVDAAPLTQTIYAPFTVPFYTNGACEPVSISYTSREEQTVSAGVSFSPPPPGPAGTSLCWETTVLTFNNANVLGSANGVSIPVNYENGWANLSFAQTYASAAAGFAGSTPAVLHTYIGLPTIGFMVQDFVNGNVGGVLSNYGGNFNHKYTTSITAVGGPAVNAE